MSDLLLETGAPDNLLLEDGDDLLLDEAASFGLIDHEPPPPVMIRREPNIVVCLGG